MARHKIYFDVPERLTNGAIKSIAEVGLENTTVRTIGMRAGVNNAFIFRYFENKDDLICKAFISESEKLAEQLTSLDTDLRDSTTKSNYMLCMHMVFDMLWNYFTVNPELGLFNSYFFHSNLYRVNCSEQYKEILNGIINSCTMLFPESNPRNLDTLYLMFETVLSYTTRIAYGDIANDFKNKETAFEAFYYTVSRGQN